MTTAPLIGGIEISPNEGWAAKFWSRLVPLKDQIVCHSLFREFKQGTLPIESIQKTLIEFYPIVKSFRDYMGLNLKKVRPERPSELKAQEWLNENILVEEKHAEYWIFWGMSFGCSGRDFETSRWSPEIKSFDRYLTDVGSRGLLVEGLAATNLAIEWPTGEWVRQARKGMEHYYTRGLVKMRVSGMKWIKAHEIYDDAHPFEAMELIKLCVANRKDQQRAFQAAKRGMELYLDALNNSYKRNVH